MLVRGIGSRVPAALRASRRTAQLRTPGMRRATLVSAVPPTCGFPRRERQVPRGRVQLLRDTSRPGPTLLGRSLGGRARWPGMRRELLQLLPPPADVIAPAPRDRHRLPADQE